MLIPLWAASVITKLLKFALGVIEAAPPTSTSPAKVALLLQSNVKAAPAPQFGCNPIEPAPSEYLILPCIVSVPALL